VLANQQLPLGRRVAIVTNAGGPGILAADACETRGLELMPIEPELAAKMREYLPATASVGNPIDMIASASANDYRRTLKLLTEDPSIDSIIVIYIPVLPDHAHEVAAAIREAAADAKGKTMVATFMGVGNPSTNKTSLEPVPSFPFPERAVAALARATHYAEWRRRPIGTGAHFDDVDVPVMREIVQRKLAAGGGWLGPLDVQSLLEAAKIPTAPMDFAATVYDAVQTAMRIGFPVVLKAVGATLLHKTESNAVILNLQDEREVRVAYDDLSERLGDLMSGVLVQRMVDGGVEVMLGATEDPTFGHVVAYGAGGTLVELMNDVSFRIHPLNDADVEDMIDEVRWSKLLQGFRGAPPCDVASLKDVILRLSELLRLCPEIRDLDINPLKVLPRGAIAVDARIRVEAVVPRPPSRRIAY
jgi:acyl-CoA synthetase (NDP forming)